MAHRVIISSIVLFFNRDWAGGAGPVVDWPSVEAPPAAPAGVVDGAAAVLGPLDAGWVAAGLEAAFPNRPPVGAGVAVVEVAAGAVVVAAGVADPVVWAPPRLGNRPPDGAAVAGVDDGAVEDVVPPKEGKRDF